MNQEQAAPLTDLMAEMSRIYTGVSLGVRLECAEGMIAAVVATVGAAGIERTSEAFGYVDELSADGLYRAEQEATRRAFARFAAANHVTARAGNQPPQQQQRHVAPQQPVQPQYQNQGQRQAPPQQHQSGTGPTQKQADFANDIVRNRSKGAAGIDDLTMYLFGQRIMEMDRQSASALIDRLKSGGHEDFFQRAITNGNPPY